MKLLIYRIFLLALLILLMVPFGLSQIYNRELSDLIMSYKLGPRTATEIVGPFCLWTYTCTFIFFASNIFGCNKIGRTAKMSILFSAVLGLIWFNVRLFISIFSLEGFDLKTLSSTNISQYFLWGSILGAVIGMIIGSFSNLPESSLIEETKDDKCNE